MCFSILDHWEEKATHPGLEQSLAGQNENSFMTNKGTLGTGCSGPVPDVCQTLEDSTSGMLPQHSPPVQSLDYPVRKPPGHAGERL